VTGPAGLAALIAGLRAWIRDHDPHVRAAVELLIEPLPTHRSSPPG